MPSANRMTTPVAVDEAQIEGRYALLDDYSCIPSTGPFWTTCPAM
jgi:hypothetical protein